jgi:hypothetical protein
MSNATSCPGGRWCERVDALFGVGGIHVNSVSLLYMSCLSFNSAMGSLIGKANPEQSGDARPRGPRGQPGYQPVKVPLCMPRIGLSRVLMSVVDLRFAGHSDMRRRATRCRGDRRTRALSLRAQGSSADGAFRGSVPPLSGVPGVTAVCAVPVQ